MTTYASEIHYLEDQVSSYVKAKKLLKEYKNKIAAELYQDFRGDRDKVIEGLDKGIDYLERERKKVKLELNDLKNQLKGL